MQTKILIRTERCKGCNICVAFCPQKILSLDSLGKVLVINPEKCIGCGQCELRCPDFAIRTYKEGQQ